MCLKRNKNIEYKVESLLEKGYIEYFKILEINKSVGGENKLCSPYQGTKYYMGVNKSNRRFLEPDLFSEYSHVHKGIHVFLKFKDALKETAYYNDVVIVKVLCRKEDFVAAGTWSDDYNIEQAVFDKVEISPEEYDKILTQTAPSSISASISTNISYTSY